MRRPVTCRPGLHGNMQNGWAMGGQWRGKGQNGGTEMAGPPKNGASQNQRQWQSTQSISCAENLIKSPSRRKDKMATRLSTIPTRIYFLGDPAPPALPPTWLSWHLFASPCKVLYSQSPSPRVAGIFQFLVIFSMARQMTKSQHFNNVLWLSRIITLGLPFRSVCVWGSDRVCVCVCVGTSANKAEIKILPGRDQWQAL